MNTRMINPLVAAALLPLAAGASDTESWIAERIEVLARENVKLERFTLPNGMICLLKADHSAPVVSVQFWVGSGSMHEEQYLGAGIAHAVEHMLFKGTPTRGPGTVSREISDAGGHVNAYTTFERTVYYADLPSSRWQTGFDVLADAVMNAGFPEAEWKLERDVILREVAMDEDSPERVLGKQLWQTALRADTRRHPVIGYADAFKTLEREDLVSWHRRHYTPANTMLVVVGDIDTAAVRRHATEQLAAFKRVPRAPVMLPVEPPQTSPRFERLTGDYQIGRLAAAWPTVAVHHPDAAALDILANIAGQGQASRLHRSLVEDRRLLHSISVWSYTPERPGFLGLSAAFAPENEEAATAAIRQEVEYLKTVPFTEPEVRKAVRSALAAQLGELETMSGQAAQFGSDMLATGDPRFSETYLRQLGSVTAADLMRVARQYLDSRSLSLILLVPERDDATTGEVTPATAAAAPGVQRLPLDSGAALIVRENSRLPFVYVAVALQGGVRAEPESKRGMTTLMADLLTRGTASRSREEIAVAIESLGASLNTYSGFNAFGLTARCLSGDADTVVRLLADCLINPLFEESEIARQRDLQIAAIRRQSEQPMVLAQRQMRAMLFPRHPYRDTPEGTVETVTALTRDDLVAHHRALTVAGNLAVSIFGDITAAEAVRLADAAFAAVPAGKTPAFGQETAPAELPSRAMQEMPREQAIVMTGFPGVSIFDPQFDALSVLQGAMSGLASELALEVRDRRGLAYFTGAMQQAGVDPGMFVLYAGTRRDAVEEVEGLLDAELLRVAEHGLREDELARSKAQMAAGHDMSLQNPLSTAQECALNECFGLGAGYLFSRPERIAAVTADEIRAVARRILDPRRKAVSLILPTIKPDSGN
jgi:zinc protease